MTGLARVLQPFRRLVPNLGAVSHAERVRASIGAMVGLLLTGFVSRLAFGATSDLPLLIAPMGASAVLLFAVPASPLAQPWSILGGNIVAALIGVTCGRLVADPVTAAALACAGAIGGMLLLRCLHPPGGAVALTAVLGGPAVHAAGYSFALWPVGLNSLLLLAAAVLFNNATGRRYPHLAPVAGSIFPPGPATRLSNRDVDAALRRHDEVLDIDRDDLLDLVRETEEAAAKRLRAARCADLMIPVASVLAPSNGIEAALASFASTADPGILVVDGGGRLAGVVRLDAVLRRLRPTRTGRGAARLFQRSIRFDLEPRRVGDVRDVAPSAATPRDGFDHVAALVVAGDLPFVPVLDEDGVLLGVIPAKAVMTRLYRREPDDQPRSLIQRL